MLTALAVLDFNGATAREIQTASQTLQRPSGLSATSDFVGFINQGVAPGGDPGQNPADLNTQVLNYALSQLGQQVGDGQCAALADTALKSAGALSFSDLGPTGDDADYVWGNLVATLTTVDHLSANIAPGDVIQFRDATFVTTTVNPDGSWSQSTMMFPHHTAVVELVNGNAITLLQQNVDGNLTVQETTINLDDMTQGTMWAYQPVASQGVAPGGDSGIAPVARVGHEIVAVAIGFLKGH